MTIQEKLDRVRSILQAVDVKGRGAHLLLENALQEYRRRTLCTHRQWWKWKKPLNYYVINLENGKSISLHYSYLEALDRYCTECGSMAILAGNPKGVCTSANEPG